MSLLVGGDFCKSFTSSDWRLQLYLLYEMRLRCIFLGHLDQPKTHFIGAEAEMKQKHSLIIFMNCGDIGGNLDRHPCEWFSAAEDGVRHFEDIWSSDVGPSYNFIPYLFD